MRAHNINWLKFSGIGFEIIGSLALFGYIGNWVDTEYRLYPFGILFGLLIGAIVVLYGIWYRAS